MDSPSRSTSPRGAKDESVPEPSPRVCLRETNDALLAASLSQHELMEPAVKARDQMLAFVAHDLSNPLAAIEMTASTMSRETDAERAQSIQLILRCVKDMKRLIGDLLDVSRLEAGRFSLRPAKADASLMCKEVIEVFSPRAASAGIDLQSSCAPALPLVAADRLQVMRVLSNLLTNAIKFTPRGGQVMLRAGGGGGEVEFSVSDTGAGIAPDDLPRVFDRFWQAERSGVGVGLGLAICKGIVEAHGGYIRAESTPGQGTTVRFTLPAAAS